MIVVFQNILTKEDTTEHLSNIELEQLKVRELWSLRGEIVWVNNVIEFTSHYSAIITPLYAWEVYGISKEWSIFKANGNFQFKLSDKLCLLREDGYTKKYSGKANISGEEDYLKTYPFDAIPELKVDDVLHFSNNQDRYRVKRFQINVRYAGEPIANRVVIVEKVRNTAP